MTEPGRIRDMRNLGPASERMLAAIGIASPAELRVVGADEAFRRLAARGEASRTMLHAMEGALSDRDWRDVAADPVRIVPAERRHAEACAAILDAWIDENDWMPRLHDAESVRWFVGDVLFAERRVRVALEGGRPVGFLALDEAEGFVAALYLARAARGRGIGKRLLDEAKAARPAGLRLWTFLPNGAARRFYAREGFTEVRRTAGDNEEGVPDVLLEWLFDPAAAI